MSTLLSWVIPTFNEESNLPELYRRCKLVMDQLDLESELIFVDDGSRDRTVEIIQELQKHDRRVCYVRLARNFGHQVAVTAGLHRARGQAAVVMDADLQDPPEEIPRMIALWREGAEVIYARRIRRHNEGWIKRGTAYVFYRVLNGLSEVEIPKDTGDFCLMDRKVVDLLNAMPERSRFIRGMRAWTGFRQKCIDFERPPRYAGSVKYTLKKSISLAIDSLVGFSQIPLRLASYLGLLAAAGAFGMSWMVVYWRIRDPQAPLTGLAAIMAITFFLASVQLASLGILGEYIGRIYEEVKFRPLYTVAEASGFDEPREDD
jgi:glycosyltransferase involved in cell wall biosynthesis